jgi:hypothetical protein
MVVGQWKHGKKTFGFQAGSSVSLTGLTEDRLRQVTTYFYTLITIPIKGVSMKKAFYTILIAGILMISGCASQSTTQQTNNTQNDTPVQPPSGGLTGTTILPSISTADLAGHDSESDCWIGYQGKVYDVTAWLPKHPGSAGAIAPYCGTASQFETAFADQHGTEQVSRLMRESVLKGNLG